MWELTKTAWARFGIYAVGLIGSALALTGLADFDTATGVFDLRPFNLYTIAGVAAGMSGNALAILAVIRHWSVTKQND